MKKICKKCGELKEHHAKGMCNNCHSKEWYKQNRERILKYRKENFVYLRMGDGVQINVFTNGVTEEIKPLISEIKKQVLDRAIKHPGRLLDQIPDNETIVLDNKENGTK